VSAVRLLARVLTARLTHDIGAQLRP
jgi:hypothetical protein